MRKTSHPFDESNSNTTNRPQWTTTPYWLLLIGVARCVGDAWPIVCWRAEGIRVVVVIIINRELVGRIHFAVPTPQRMNRQILTCECWKIGQGNSRNTPSHGQLGRASLSASRSRRRSSTQEANALLYLLNLQALHAACTELPRKTRSRTRQHHGIMR